MPHYLEPARKVPSWLETTTGFEVSGCSGTVSGGWEFLRMLEQRVDWRNPRLARTTFPEDDKKPRLALYSSLRRGWFFGSENFREKLLKMLSQRAARIEKANGYHGAQLRREAGARSYKAALEHFGTDLETLREARKGDSAQGLTRGSDSKGNDDETGLDHRAAKLETRAGVCRLASETRKRFATDRALRRDFEAILKNATLNG